MYLIHKEESKVSGNLRISIIRHGKHSLNLYTTETRFHDFKVNLDISEISIDKIVVSNIILKSKNKFNCFFYGKASFFCQFQWFTDVWVPWTKTLFWKVFWEPMQCYNNLFYQLSILKIPSLLLSWFNKKNEDLTI